MQGWPEVLQDFSFGLEGEEAREGGLGVGCGREGSLPFRLTFTNFFYHDYLPDF
jgi:hypothetical protein